MASPVKCEVKQRFNMSLIVTCDCDNEADNLGNRNGQSISFQLSPNNPAAGLLRPGIVQSRRNL